MGTYIALGSAKTLEAFVCAVGFQFVVMLARKMATLSEMISLATEGIKSVMSAILILAMAYCINTISKELGTANYVISITEEWMSPTVIVVLTFFGLCIYLIFYGYIVGYICHCNTNLYSAGI